MVHIQLCVQSKTNGGKQTMVTTKVSYSRKFNLGNYETQDCWIEADLEPGEDPITCIKKLKEMIENAFKK